MMLRYLLDGHFRCRFAAQTSKMAKRAKLATSASSRDRHFANSVDWFAKQSTVGQKSALLIITHMIKHPMPISDELLAVCVACGYDTAFGGWREAKWDLAKLARALHKVCGIYNHVQSPVT